MNDNIFDLGAYDDTDEKSLSDRVCELSDEFERDSRRYDRGFSEEREVG